MTSVIIPVYNISKRGAQRLYFSIMSLQHQHCSIWVIDGSDETQRHQIEEICSQFLCHYEYYPTEEFNMPILHNRGIRICDTDWVLTTGADFLFAPDFIDTCRTHRSKDRMLFKEVGMLGKTNITKSRILNWVFPKTGLNEWHHEANGGSQYTTRKWFLKNPYDEQMSGFGAMDNLCGYKAYVTGLELYWLTESELLHIWHPIQKYKTPEDIEKTERNHRILQQYCLKHNLTKEVLKGNMYERQNTLQG